MANIKDTDYLALSVRVHAMEGTLLSKERLERLLDAPDREELVKLLSQYGFGDSLPTDPAALDAVLSLRWARVTEGLADGLPDPRLLEVFKVRYDYHNIKTILKATLSGRSAEGLLMEGGRVPPATLTAAAQGQDVSLPRPLEQALQEGLEVLSSTGDPQRLDFFLDKAYFSEMATLAKETGSRYLEGYVALMVDTANLRCLVRALRMKKSPEFLKGVLFEGGRVSHSGILSVAANGGDRLTELYAPTVLADAAQLGAAALSGGGLTGFERACDNALTRYLGEAKYIPFGEAPVIGFLAALESELVNLRILLAGRQAGLGKDVIRERLRESYV